MASNNYPQEPVAIIGMACRLPGGVTDVDKLWDLLEKGRTTWSQVPDSRFRESSFFHPDSKRNGTFHTQGGHFLTNDISCFDASFFNISPAEAKAMDPQLRLLLEVTYEALESSGIPLDQLRGTDTAAYVALYNQDYEKILLRDPEDLPFYYQTGNGEAMYANRLSYFFDLHGASLTLDTGCSGGMVALHQACESIRHGECTQAIAAASNLILDPAAMIGPSCLQFYASDGRSKSFDQCADGYGRGEGACTLILKRLTAAIEDGDPIRAVIRSSVINQDGRTAGITVPSGEAQERLIRSGYEAAGLDPAKTSYVETHGSGTAVGDLTESRSIGTVLGQARRAQGLGPVLMGSVKANIGHLENVSGLAGVIKAALVIAKGQIPPSIKFQVPNPEIQWDAWNLDLPTNLRALSQFGVGSSQVSLNSFGFGGTNVHIILDQLRDGEGTNSFIPVDLAMPTQQQIKANTDPSQVFVLSARSAEPARHMAKQLQEYLEKVSVSDEESPSFLQSLAYTLYCRRSSFPWRAAVVADSVSELHQKLNSVTFCHTGKRPSIAFVFTGQGAQWARMGRELWETSIPFRNSISAAEQCLTDLGVDWRLTEELLKSPEETNLNKANIAQPACTAIQLALVDLLASWNIHPSAVTGHSSGEIAAAYACKAISFHNAMLIAYARGCVAGKLAKDESLKGAMIAVGLSPQEVERYRSKSSESTGLATIACVNSPEAVTLSGDKAAVDDLQERLQSDGIFFRRLPVDVAYHSHHILRVANDYRDALVMMDAPRANHDIPFHSSVTGKIIDGTELDAQYWVKNLVSPVLFSAAVESLMNSATNLLIEIGPHAALKGPIKQILKAHNVEVPYAPSLNRNESASRCILQLASSIFEHGAEINMSEVNIWSRPADALRCLFDLPPYPWDHSNSFWHESRLSQNYRNRTDHPHELLGVLSPESSSLEPRWRNHVSVSSFPWLTGHRIGGDAVFPAAAYMAMAIEAAYIAATHLSTKIDPVCCINLHQVSLSRSLIIPSSGSAVEIMLTLRLATGTAGRDLARRQEFVIYSCSDHKDVVENCRGFVTVNFGDIGPLASIGLDRQFEEQRLSPLNPDQWYHSLSQIGVEYSDSFRALSRLSAGRGFCSANIACSVPESEYKASLPPASFDACLQTMLAAIGSGDVIRGPILPTFINEASIWVNGRDVPPSILHVSSRAQKQYGQAFSADIETTRGGLGSSSLLLSLRGVEAKSLEVFSNQNEESEQAKTCQKQVMAIDPDFLSGAGVEDLCNSSLQPVSVAASLTRLRDVCQYYANAAVKEVTDEDVQGMSTYQRLYFDWLRVQATLCSVELTNDVLDQVKPSNAEGKMVCKIGASLSSILKGGQDPLSLMLEDNLLFRLYEDDKSMQRCAVQAAEYARMMGLKSPDLRILEIGGGTGGATLPILQALTQYGTRLFSHYAFTDISAGFFANAEQKLGDWKDLMSFQKLNIEEDPTKQGFEPGNYDLIIAANVLHATTYIEETVKHVRRLLKPGGKLLLLESTRTTVHRSFVFGTLPGWWVGASERGKDTPLLTEEEWSKTLQRTGFTGLDAIMHSYQATEEQTDSLIVTTALEGSASIAEAAIAVALTGEQLSRSHESIGYSVMHHMRSLASQEEVAILSLGDSRLQDRTCILFTDPDRSLLCELNQAGLDALKHTVKIARKVIWVTLGGTHECQNPQSSVSVGFARVLRRENPHVPIITLDLDPNNNPQPLTLAKYLWGFLHQLLSRPRIEDLEWSERRGQWFVPRLVEDKATTEFVSSHSRAGQTAVPQMEFFHQEDRPLSLATRDTGSLQGLYFSDSLVHNAPMGEDELEIEVKASGVNFRDIMVSLNQMPDENVAECAGVVTKVGQKLRKTFSEGDRVYTWHVPRYSSHVRCSGLWTKHIPLGVSFEEAAAIPIAYCTAYHCLVNEARLRTGDTILIHSGAGGVGQAAILLALHLGATVFTTVGSAEKKQLLITQYGLLESHIFSSRSKDFAGQIKSATNGRGVDVVLNALAGSLLQHSLEVLAPLGRFVEIGKNDILAHARLDLSPFGKSISFSTVDLVQLACQKPRRMAEVFSDVHQLLTEHVVKPPFPLNIRSITNLEEVLRLMQKGQSMGKVVISHGPNDMVKVMPRSPPVAQLRPDASYLIVGGQGGLGRALCAWMARCGAKVLVAISPSGADKPLTKGLVEELAQMGVQLHAMACDVGNRLQLQSTLAYCKETLPPIRGIIHSGLTLRNGSFENMSLDDLRQVLHPKLAGSYNLHDSFEGQQLDFFVILSSYVGLLGSPGQANYAAASTFQDAFARWRTGLGQPTYSLDLGTVQGAGSLHEKPEALAHFERLGLGGIPLQALYALVGYTMSKPIQSWADSQIAIGWAPPSTWTKADYAALDPRLSHLRSSPIPSRNDDSSRGLPAAGMPQASEPLSLALPRCLSLEERVSTIIAALSQQIVSILGVAAEDVDEGKSIADHGGDSLVAIEFRNWFRKEVGCSFSTEEVSNLLSVHQLACQAAN
ncbi:hypothetical protein BGW36DRAFT_438769 [Talaromyces proteolyticus]|uniref:Polyketide synthase n=1 Tax=Talaromyces proteolyticus TaxID=1131652 RepID=A0AAD4KGI8_9EURO|nr:uncharacterized protein BGW36DRAFT_438769 [Talaromyces proteolyticus]KAH8691225.1 hypothetical protein BGW36DRAFT_438769 [Talaromyces proteolyticus]